MVRDDTSRNFDIATRREVAGRGLEEEERLLRNGIVELLDVVSVVAPNGDYLQHVQSCFTDLSAFSFLPSCHV